MLEKDDDMGGGSILWSHKDVIYIFVLEKDGDMGGGNILWSDRDVGHIFVMEKEAFYGVIWTLYTLLGRRPYRKIFLV